MCIGDNVYVREGVSIGRRSVIGANAVVTKNVESHAVYAGVPARGIGAIEEDAEASVIHPAEYHPEFIS